MKTYQLFSKSFRPALGAFALVLALLTVATCNKDTTSEAMDMATAPPDQTFFTCCGRPNDPNFAGNSKGIGKYCMSTTECAANLICSTAQPEKRVYFCTRLCSGANDTTTCGENTTCTEDKSNPGIYGCVPTQCLSNMPAGCSN